MNDHLSPQPVVILALLVRMIPMGSRRIGHKRVRVGPSWLDRTLGYPAGAIICLRPFLEHAMKMERCGFISQVIVNGDHYSVSDICFNNRDPCRHSAKVHERSEKCCDSRPLTVDANNWSGVAIWGSLHSISDLLTVFAVESNTVTYRYPTDIEVIGHCLRRSRDGIHCEQEHLREL